MDGWGGIVLALKQTNGKVIEKAISNLTNIHQHKHCGHMWSRYSIYLTWSRLMKTARKVYCGLPWELLGNLTHKSKGFKRY